MKVTCNLQQRIKERSNGVYNRISAKIWFPLFLLSFCILWLSISLRCETFRKLSWPLCESSYDMSNESSRLDLSEKILLQTSESLESSSLSWLHSKKCSRRPWRKLGIETDETKPVFTSLVDVILDAILFICMSPSDVLAKILAALLASATRDGTICSKNINFVPYHRDKARSRAHGLFPLWLLLLL